MRNWVRRTALAVLLPVALACGSDPNGPSNDAGEMTASIDGSPFVGDLDVQAFLVNGTLTVSGMDQVSRRITLTVPSAAVGTYTLGPNQVTSATLYLGSFAWITNTTGMSGSISITAFSASQASGTFQFTAKALDPNVANQVRTVSSGTFEVRY